MAHTIDNTLVKDTHITYYYTLDNTDVTNSINFDLDHVEEVIIGFNVASGSSPTGGLEIRFWLTNAGDQTALVQSLSPGNVVALPRISRFSLKFGGTAGSGNSKLAVQINRRRGF